MGNSAGGAGCLPLEKGQNAHILPLLEAACGHFEARSLVRRPHPARDPPPARAPHPAPPPTRSNPAHVPGLVSMGQGAPGPCVPRR